MTIKNINVGDVFTSNSGSQCVVIDYVSSRNVKIQFLDDRRYETVVHANNLRKGQIRNPYRPTVCGVGYFGVGSYKSWMGGKLTPEYVKWANMLKRCYDPAFIRRNPTYRGCRVHEDWHDFQVFSLWLNDQPLWGREGLDLDKDLLKEGNKIYSEQTCVLIPQRINYLLVRPTRENGLPVGVHFRGNRYHARCRTGNSGYDALGAFDTPEEAFAAYKSFKERVIKSVAMEYRGEISEQIFEALMRFNVTP